MNRDRAIDIAKGIGIILMVIGHFDDLGRVTSHLIYSFHMPLFFIFSGYFFKEQDSKRLIKNCKTKLLKPFAITTIIGAFFSWLIVGPDLAIGRITGALVGNAGGNHALIKLSEFHAGTIWFLMALFWCRILFNELYKRYSKRYLFLSFIISLVAGLSAKGIISLPLCLSVGATALFFYAMGVWLNQHGIPSLKYRILLYIIWIISVQYGYLNMAHYAYTLFPVCILGALGGTLVTYELSRKIMLCWGGVSRILCFLGEKSLIVLCCHHIAFVTRPFICSHYLSDIDKNIGLNIALLLLTVLYSLIIIFIQNIFKK